MSTIIDTTVYEEQVERCAERIYGPLILSLIGQELAPDDRSPWIPTVAEVETWWSPPLESEFLGNIKRDPAKSSALHWAEALKYWRSMEEKPLDWSLANSEDYTMEGRRWME